MSDSSSLRQRGSSRGVARSGELTPNAGEGGEEEEQSRVEEELPLWVGCACCSLFIGLIVLLIVAGYKLSPGADAFDQTRVVALKKDEMFRTVIYPTQGRSLHRGPNGKATDWAVFFYKPYCPACKRVWPVFRALGNTVNDSGLRFGEVDCVRDRGLCNLVGAESHPLIRIYKAVPSQAKESNWKRESVAEWQGLLIAYEINQWFIDQQAAGVIQAGVEWPSPERLALEMRSLKASGRVSHETTMLKRPQNAGGYIHDAELALQYGLIDHVLLSSSSDGSSKPTLSGERLLSLLRWISLQQEMFPRSAVRDKLEALFKRLQHRTSWSEAAYEKALRGVGFDTSPVDDTAWHWCTPAGPTEEALAPTVGGYTCGLWLLFHTTLANSDRLSAPDVLINIRDWVENFFGCSHCAAHFVKYFNEHHGAHTRDHIGAVLWLWRAHNAVSMRLRRHEQAAADDRGGRPRMLWPSLALCEACYKESFRGNESVPSTISATDDLSEQWENHNVFEYHQETFCFESDTFVCSGFDDPSRDQDQRKLFREALANGIVSPDTDEKKAT